MSYPTESAIQNHYLDSILPHPSYPEPKQFLKTKQFYKPESFIWNNPHRASEHMYKFYHVYNDQYSKYMEPKIKELELKDREQAEIQRIHRLIAFRNKAREEFQSKQKYREMLETKTYQKGIASTRGIKNETNGLAIQSKYKSQSSIKDDYCNRIQPADREIQQSQRLLKIENTYKQGLKKYDIKTEQISKMITNQNEEYHRKIRSQFINRKNINNVTNSKFYRGGKKEGWVNRV